MFNLNGKYFSISERYGRNHQNKFCLSPPKRRLCPWELNTFYSDFDRQTHIPGGETPDESLVTKFLLTVIDFMKWFLDQSSLHVSSVVQTHVRTA